MKISVTDVIGFIGYHSFNRNISVEHKVIGLDNVHEYYDFKIVCKHMGQAGVRYS